MSFTPPPNEAARVARLSQGERQRYAELRQGAEKVAQKNPDMDTDVNTRFLDAYLNGVGQHRTAMQRINTPNAAGAPVDPRYTLAQSKRFQLNFIQNFDRSVKSHEREAWNAYGKEMQPKSIFAGMTEQFYNTDKGGFQAGGLIGGLIAGTVAFLGFGNGGGWLGLIGTAVAALTGAWLGNKALGAFGGDDKKPAPTPYTGRTASADPQKGKTKTADLPANVQHAAREAVDSQADVKLAENDGSGAIARPIGHIAANNPSSEKQGGKGV